MSQQSYLALPAGSAVLFTFFMASYKVRGNNENHSSHNVQVLRHLNAFLCLSLAVQASIASGG